MYTPPALCMAELSSLNQTLPAVPGVSPPPLPAPSHLGAQLGTSGHSVALEPSISTAGYHGRGAGQPPPPGDELQSNKARWSQRQRFMPAINQEAQTALFPAGLAEREAGVGAQGSWGFMGGPAQGGSAGHLCTCLPKAAVKRFKSQSETPKLSGGAGEVWELGPGEVLAEVLQVLFCHLLISLISNG